jgi:hypothetical protein
MAYITGTDCTHAVLLPDVATGCVRADHPVRKSRCAFARVPKLERAVAATPVTLQALWCRP